MISVAKGEMPADLILSNARIVNTLSGEIEEGNVAICGQLIAGVGDYEQGQQVIDLKGKYLSPGLINGHIHLESSMLHISQYARAVVPVLSESVMNDTAATSFSNSSPKRFRKSSSILRSSCFHSSDGPDSRTRIFTFFV